MSQRFFSDDTGLHAAPPRVKQLSDSIYELYNPGASSRLNVVFFHGLQLSHNSDSHLSTWTSRGSQQEVWPMTWLPEEFPEARILCVSYDSCIRRSAEHGRLDLHNAAEMLIVNLKLAKVCQHPIILIGHSYGGLVIKQLCLEAHMRESLTEGDAGFLNCIKGVFFYGTPHHGSEFFSEFILRSFIFAHPLEDLIRSPGPFLEELVRSPGPFFDHMKHFLANDSDVSPLLDHMKHFLANDSDVSPLLDFVQVLCVGSARLHQMFDSLRLNHKWSIAGVGELKPTTIVTKNSWWRSELEELMGVSKSVMIVHEASARYGEFTMEQEDHFSLCQPKSKVSNTYRRLTEFIRCIGEDIYGFKGMRSFHELKKVPKMAMVLRSHLFETVRNYLVAAPLVGLHGMGGVGKTTLAKLLFNDLCAEFDYTCFIPGSNLKGDYDEMRRSMYSSTHHHGRKVEHGGEHVKLRSRFLLVLDDIEDAHVDFLFDISSDFDRGNSRYIVTSRNKEILDRCIVTSRHENVGARVFLVDCLSHENSKELFMTHAFSHPTNPSPSLWTWINQIVAKCEGLPLTLVVMGSYLKSENDGTIWEECFHALDKAEKVVNFEERLWSKLQVSYDRLNPKEQEMFLDAATFFNNSTWNLQTAKSCWREIYGNFQSMRWKTLVDLSLVYDVSEDDCIQMHEQMRSLGVKLASAWGYKRICRTWTEKNVSFPSPIPPREETKEVRSLRLEVSLPWTSIPRIDFLHMEKLQYLELVQFLELRSDSKLELLLNQRVLKFPRSVVLLQLRGFNNRLERYLSTLPDLVALDLKAPLTWFPTTVTRCRHLEVMKFEACLFEDFPPTFVELHRLRHLTFSSCNGLRSLPETFRLLSELRYLELRKCNKFEALPDSFGNLHSLKSLIMASLDNLQRLPQDFGALSNLERLVISDAPKISELPDSFGELHRLQDLHLDNMSSLRALPYSFGNLSQLWRLSMVGCAMTNELPDSFGDLPNLTNLDFRDCRSAEVFPASMHVIRRLPRLRYLIVQTRESEGNLSESELRALWTGEQPIK